MSKHFKKTGLNIRHDNESKIIDYISHMYNVRAHSLFLMKTSMKSSCFTAHEMFLLMNFIHLLVRYAAEGMWDRDSYSCDDVRMANYFAYNVPNSNLKQILMLRLFAGRTIELGADPALLLPHSVPQKNNNFVSKRFDTVIGHHPSGHQIFAVYSNERSYPEYLIT